MTARSLWLVVPLVLGAAACAADVSIASDPIGDGAPSDAARRDRDGLRKVKHVIVLMQENHSFDNYFGALALAPGSPYHAPRHGQDRGCRAGDHRCVDGLRCELDAAGAFRC